jgi:hypothetical protein
MFIGAGSTIKGGVTVAKPLPPVSCTITPDQSTIDEGGTVNFEITTTAIPDNTTLYFWLGGNINASRFSPGAGGTFIVNSGVSGLSLTVSADMTTEGPGQLFQVYVGTGDVSGLIGLSEEIHVNDTSTTRPGWSDGDTHASGPVYTYQYYRFTVIKTRSADQFGSTQLSELIILRNGARLTGGYVNNFGGTSNPNEGPSKAVDGYYDNKWCDTNYRNNNNVSVFSFTFDSQLDSNGFTYATANDYAARDPVQWIVEGSNDNANWDLINVQASDASITTDRETLVAPAFNWLTRGSLAFDGTTNQSLQVAASNVWALGSTCTIEFWVKLNISSAGVGSYLGAIMSQHDGGGGSGIDIFQQGGNLCFSDGDNIGYYAEPTSAIWTHVAVVFPGSGTPLIFYNGIQQTQVGGVMAGTAQFNDTADGLTIGKRGPTVNYQYFNGYITNIKITTTADYASNFTPAVLPSRSASTVFLWIPSDQSILLDQSTNLLSITANGVTYNPDHQNPPVIPGGVINSTVHGDSYTHAISYTNTGGPIDSITVKDAPTLGTINIVDTTLFYVAPCNQGKDDEYDNFSLYFTGSGITIIVAVSITINPY